MATSWTLDTAAQLLRVPSQQLSVLCKKNVIAPDALRSSSRSVPQFSRRNLFDIAIALELGRLDLSLWFARAVLRTLLMFESQVFPGLGDSSLLDALGTAGAPRVMLLIVDGQRLFIRVEAGSGPPRFFRGIDGTGSGPRGRTRYESRVTPMDRAGAAEALRAAQSRMELDVSDIARNLTRRLAGESAEP